MKRILSDISGKKIKAVYYSEVNCHDRKIFHDGFDSFDFGINLEMTDNSLWNLSWSDNEYFEVQKGKKTHNTYLPNKDVKTVDATERWRNIINLSIDKIDFSFIDEHELIPSGIKILFEDNKEINILIGEALNKNETIPTPLEFDLGGEIYVFHDQNLLKKHLSE